MPLTKDASLVAKRVVEVAAVVLLEREEVLVPAAKGVVVVVKAVPVAKEVLGVEPPETDALATVPFA